MYEDLAFPQKNLTPLVQLTGPAKEAAFLEFLKDVLVVEHVSQNMMALLTLFNQRMPHLNFAECINAVWLDLNTFSDTFPVVLFNPKNTSRKTYFRFLFSTHRLNPFQDIRPPVIFTGPRRLFFYNPTTPKLIQCVTLPKTVLFYWSTRLLREICAFATKHHVLNLPFWLKKYQQTITASTWYIQR